METDYKYALAWGRHFCLQPHIHTHGRYVHVHLLTYLRGLKIHYAKYISLFHT